MKYIPIISYTNLKISKPIIYKQNNNRSGIYLWINIITNESYVGSVINLTQRLKKYFSFNNLRKALLRSKSRIHNSLLKYDYDNFKLEIIEYCQPNLLIKRE